MKLKDTDIAWANKYYIFYKRFKAGRIVAGVNVRGKKSIGILGNRWCWKLGFQLQSSTFTIWLLMLSGSVSWNNPSGGV